MSNNILNYFKKVDSKNNTPLKTNESINNETKKTPLSASKASNSNAKKQLLLENSNKKPKKEVILEDKENDKMETDIYDNENDEDEIIKPISKVKRSLESKDSPRIKRRRLVVRSDDEEDDDGSDSENNKKEKKSKKKTSDDEYKIDEEEDEDDDEVFIDDDDDFIDDGSDEEARKPKKPKKTIISKKGLTKNALKASPKTSKSVTNSPAPKAVASSLDSFAANQNEDSNGPVDITKYKHYSFEFLKEEKIKDINGNKKGDPDYDPRTLYVPPEFKKTLTPALRQWWELKSTNFDVLFFFKVGKFYELYHQDAVIAVKELGLSFMRGDYAHCGFPEIAFSRFADALVSKGYKVGRVEQTETPEMMSERVKGTRQDKTVRREICRITTPGTKTFNILDSEATNAFSNYLYSVIEKINIVNEKKTRTYGICFVDTTVGKIYMGQFEDDRNCSKLRTTFAQYPPAQILFEKNSLSKDSKNIIDLQNGMKEALNHDSEMYSSSKILRLLSESDYFKNDKEIEFKWPESFKPVLSDHDCLGLTAKNEFDLAVNALGGIVWCLKKCLIDNEILSMKNFEIYQPVENILTNDIKQNEIRKKLIKQKYMILDSISLTNLEVIENNYDNSQSGTLYEQLDFCSTNFGKRLLKYWIVNPLCDPDAINERLDAIEDLKNMDEKLDLIRDQLKMLPDLERLISKIHQLGNVRKDHPESRAIMYENDVYSKKKIEDFISMLNGFMNANKLLISLKDTKFKSKLLKSILTINTNDENKKKTGFPYLDELLKFYNQSFDAEKAKSEGKIIPSDGVNEDYDSAMADLKEVDKKFNALLKEQKKHFNCELKYFGTNKNRYQIEIPESKCNKLPSEFELISSKKGFKRYWMPEIKEYLQELTDAESRRDQALRDTTKSLFKNFDRHYEVWNRAVQCLSILDVLISLVSYVRNAPDIMCRPEIVVLDEENDLKNPFIEIINGRHPCLVKTFGGDFIPNDVLIGCEDAESNWQKHPLLILTGPNMGGKSTLMRQTGLTTQMGCYVPAEKCRISPVDRIFTRIGASDKILAGESTFFLELSETASILHHATKHSLVLMDELGRGTATFDGTAIAFSVVKDLAQRVNCRTLFSTHYHHLVEEFSHNDKVSMGHMQSMVNDDDHSITFLYKFGEGACPKSHGFNAAKLADIPDEIIKVGSVKAVEFENFTKRIQLLKKLIHSKSKSDVNNLISKFEEITTN